MRLQIYKLKTQDKYDVAELQCVHEISGSKSLFLNFFSVGHWNSSVIPDSEASTAYARVLPMKEAGLGK